MSHIKTIEIKNFKSIRHQKIEDCRRVNIFIGYPNVGKSNILEALGLFGVNEISKFNLSSFVRFESPALLFFDGNIYENISIKINEEIDLSIFPGGPYPLDFSCTTNRKSIDKGNVDNIDGDALLYNYSLLPDLKNVTPFKSVEKNKEYGISEIKKYVFEKNVVPETGNLKILKHPNGANIFDIISGNKEIKKNVIDIFKKYDLQFFFDTGTRNFQLSKELGQDEKFLIPYSMVADTLQRVIFYEASILSNKDSILLFEEPETHMFPPYIRQFTADVMFDKTNQFFIATHSPFVIDEFIEEIRDELAVYAVDYDKGETIIKRLTDDEVIEVAQYGVDLFFNLESYLDKHVQSHSA